MPPNPPSWLVTSPRNVFPKTFEYGCATVLTYIKTYQLKGLSIAKSLRMRFPAIYER